MTALLLVLTGCSAAPAAQTTPAPASAEPASVAVPDVTGQDGATARTALAAEGILAAFESDTQKAVIVEGNWTVIKTVPPAGTKVAPGTKITEHVTKPAATPEAPAPAVEPEPEPEPAQPVAPAPAVSYANCTEARAAGAAPIRRGEPGYAPKLDRDGDGIACE